MELNRIGLGWAATQMVWQSNGAASKGQGSNSSPPTLLIESREKPSKCYCLVCCACTDFLQLPKALLRLLVSLPLSKRSHWKHKQLESGKLSRELSGRIHVIAKVFMYSFYCYIVLLRLRQTTYSYHMLQNKPSKTFQSVLTDLKLGCTGESTSGKTDKNTLDMFIKSSWESLGFLLQSV